MLVRNHLRGVREEILPTVLVVALVALLSGFGPLVQAQGTGGGSIVDKLYRGDFEHIGTRDADKADLLGVSMAIDDMNLGEDCVDFEQIRKELGITAVDAKDEHLWLIASSDPGTVIAAAPKIPFMPGNQAYMQVLYQVAARRDADRGARKGSKGVTCPWITTLARNLNKLVLDRSGISARHVRVVNPAEGLASRQANATPVLKLETLGPYVDNARTEYAGKPYVEIKVAVTNYAELPSDMFSFVKSPTSGGIFASDGKILASWTETRFREDLSPERTSLFFSAPKDDLPEKIYVVLYDHKHDKVYRSGLVGVPSAAKRSQPSPVAVKPPTKN